MLEGDNVILRGLELDDVDELMKYWNDPEVRKFLLMKSPNSKEEEIEWIKNSWERRRKGECYVFAIVMKDKDKNLFIGNIELSIQDHINRRAEIGIVIFNTQYWNKGYGSEAMELILEFGFNTLNLNSIELELYETNTRAQACYKKVGLKEVGRRRSAQFFEGKFIDSILMDMLASEWRDYQITQRKKN